MTFVNFGDFFDSFSPLKDITPIIVHYRPSFFCIIYSEIFLDTKLISSVKNNFSCNLQVTPFKNLKTHLYPKLSKAAASDFVPVLLNPATKIFRRLPSEFMKNKTVHKMEINKFSN